MFLGLWYYNSSVCVGLYTVISSMCLSPVALILTKAPVFSLTAGPLLPCMISFWPLSRNYVGKYFFKQIMLHFEVLYGHEIGQCYQENGIGFSQKEKNNQNSNYTIDLKGLFKRWPREPGSHLKRLLACKEAAACLGILKVEGCGYQQKKGGQVAYILMIQGCLIVFVFL